jgi:hypothetical protein
MVNIKKNILNDPVEYDGYYVYTQHCAWESNKIWSCFDARLYILLLADTPNTFCLIKKFYKFEIFHNIFVIHACIELQVG